MSFTLVEEEGEWYAHTQFNSIQFYIHVPGLARPIGWQLPKSTELIPPKQQQVSRQVTNLQSKEVHSHTTALHPEHSATASTPLPWQPGTFAHTALATTLSQANQGPAPSQV